MPNLLVKEIGAELLREVNYFASVSGMTQREWVIKILMEAVDGPRKVVRFKPTEKVPDVRSGVRGKRRANGAAAVLGPSGNTSTDRSTVERGSQQNSGEQDEKAVERVYVGPPHSPRCDCSVCLAKKR